MATLYDNFTNNMANVRSGMFPSRLKRAAGGQVFELRLHHGWPESGQVEWCLREDDRIAAHGTVDNLSDIPAGVRHAPLHVWSPVEDTLFTSVRLPTRSQSKIARALPFALEDRLLGDPQEQFFTSTRNKDGSLSVTVTANARLQGWIAALHAAGLAPESLAPENLAIPLMEDSWLLFYDEHGCWLRTGRDAGLPCDPDGALPPYLLRRALGEAPAKPGTLVVYNTPERFDQAAWQEQLGLEILTENASFWEAAEPGQNRVSLLQNEFRPRKRRSAALGSLRPAAYMIAAWLLGTIFYTGFSWWQLSSEYSNLHNDMITIFRSSFPKEAGVIVDPYRQMQANLERGNHSGSRTGNAGFLEQLGGVAPIVSRFTNVAITEIDFNSNSLTIGLALPDYRTLETVKTELSNRSIAYSVLTTRQKEGKVITQIRLTQGARS